MCDLLQAVCNDVLASSYVQAQLEAEGRSSGHRGFEIIRKVLPTYLQPFLHHATEASPCSAGRCGKDKHVAEQQDAKLYIVLQVHLSAQEFTVQNGLVTPSHKLKRAQLKQVYAKAVSSMYKDLEN